MMKKRIEVEDKLIDKFYNEGPHLEPTSKSDFEFNEKLDAFSRIMNEADQFDFDLNINILSIIDNAESMKEKRKFRIELLLFLFTSLSIILFVMTIALRTDIRFIFISQIIFTFLLPLLVIPASRRKKLRGDYND